MSLNEQTRASLGVLEAFLDGRDAAVVPAQTLLSQLL
jgi:hypothetical protein